MGSELTGGKIRSVDRTFEIIEQLVALDGAGVSELADYLEIPNSTAHDYLDSLYQREYLIKRGQQYYVSTRFLDIGAYVQAQRKFYQIAKDEVDQLAADTGEHANMMIEEHGYGVFLYTAEGDRAVRLDTQAGMHIPLQSSALGKCIFSALSDDEVHEILDKVGMPRITKRTIVDRDELFEELEQIREQGYAFDIGERVEGMKCVAAPVKCDEIIGAISVSGPTSRLTGDRFTEELPSLVTRAANVIEINLKYS